MALHVLHASSKSPLEASGPKNAIIGPFVTAPYLGLGTWILIIIHLEGCPVSAVDK